MKYLGLLALSLPGGKVINSPASPKFKDLGSFISETANLAFYAAGFLMLVWMSWGVFQYIFAGGNKESLAKARSRITWAIVGFLFILIAFAISNFVKDIYLPDSAMPKVQDLTPVP